VTTTYDSYRRALAQLKDLPSRTAADLEHGKRSHDHAGALADDAVRTADAAADDMLKAIEAQLTSARSALEPLGTSNLVPPHIRPSGGVTTASRDDVAKAQQSLAAAVNQLRQAVQSELHRSEVDHERLAREAAERERLARDAGERTTAAVRRKQLIRLGVAGAVLLAALVVILIVTL
jgi:hypothetical protein